MPKNNFNNNRHQVQQAFENDGFLVPLTEDNTPYTIEEKSVKAGSNKLREVSIDNIPFTDEIRPVSYILELELEGKIFSRPPKFKTVEKAILLFTKLSLYVIMVEMKTSLKPDGDSGIYEIKKKIQDSVGRVSLFLTHYILDTTLFDNYSIKFINLLLYNNQSITGILPQRPELRNEELVKILTGSAVPFFVTDALGNTNKVDVKLIQNNGRNAEKMNIDFDQIFASDDDYQTALAGDDNMTFPVIITT